MTATQEISRVQQEITRVEQDLSRVRGALDRPYCQVPDCHRRAARLVEIELPAAWEATPTYTALTLHAGFCVDHGYEVERRVGTVLEPRDDLHNLLVIVEAAILAWRGFRTTGGPA